jgi:hypothetical protein
MAKSQTAPSAEPTHRSAPDSELAVKSRRLVFDTAPVKIALHIHRGAKASQVDVDGTLQIDGKYFPSRDIAVNGFSVQLVRNDAAIADSTIENDGAFCFRQVTPGRYGVKFYTKRMGFHLRPVSLSLSPAGAIEG